MSFLIVCTVFFKQNLLYFTAHDMQLKSLVSFSYMLTWSLTFLHFLLIKFGVKFSNFKWKIHTCKFFPMHRLVVFLSHMEGKLFLEKQVITYIKCGYFLPKQYFKCTYRFIKCCGRNLLKKCKLIIMVLNSKIIQDISKWYQELPFS